MSKRLFIVSGIAFAAALAAPIGAVAAGRAPTDAMVQFGQPTFPQDAAPLNHFLLPDEVTIARGGTVTFEVNGLNHDIAIYPVDTMTTRAQIDAGLCQPDPATCSPLGAATANLQYFVVDAAGDLVIDSGMNPPSNRVNDPFERLLYAGGPVFLTGRADNGAVAQQIQYRFDKIGRYLIVCANRNHLINDHMFGFINVVRARQEVAD